MKKFKSFRYLLILIKGVVFTTIMFSCAKKEEAAPKEPSPKVIATFNYYIPSYLPNLDTTEFRDPTVIPVEIGAYFSSTPKYFSASDRYDNFKFSLIVNDSTYLNEISRKSTTPYDWTFKYSTGISLRNNITVFKGGIYTITGLIKDEDSTYKTVKLVEVKEGFKELYFKSVTFYGLNNSKCLVSNDTLKFSLSFLDNNTVNYNLKQTVYTYPAAAQYTNPIKINLDNIKYNYPLNPSSVIAVCLYDKPSTTSYCNNYRIYNLDKEDILGKYPSSITSGDYDGTYATYELEWK